MIAFEFWSLAGSLKSKVRLTDDQLNAARRMSFPHIIRNPAILGGKPIIAGTRISVELILELIAAGRTPEDILEGYPSLTETHIAEAMSWGIRLKDKPSLAGALKGHLPKDAVAWQRKIRKEWDR